MRGTEWEELGSKFLRPMPESRSKKMKQCRCSSGEGVMQKSARRVCSRRMEYSFSWEKAIDDALQKTYGLHCNEVCSPQGRVAEFG